MDHYSEAIQRINDLVDEAGASDMREPMAMSLGTVDKQGRPMVRTVLLKQVDERGLVFFTNRNSRKGQHLLTNKYASICIYYQQAHQQVQIDGSVEAISDAESDEYWRGRARGSQIGAWASKQSEVLGSRRELHELVDHFEKEFAGMDVPRPDHWGGYRVRPERIEFWSGHPDRLNQRDEYLLVEGEWGKRELFP